MEMRSYGADSIKELVAFANKKELTREDVVAVLPLPTGGFSLIYFDVD